VAFSCYLQLVPPADVQRLSGAKLTLKLKPNQRLAADSIKARARHFAAKQAKRFPGEPAER